MIAFFRIYNLAGVPSEPTSDHAEKLLDVYDVSQGLTHIFFPRNTGREAIQMYLTLVVSWIFGTGLSFLSLKIGTVICGLATLPYLYLLGKEFGGKRIGLLAVFFAGIAYWPNVISRFGLRFPLYPLFVAPTLYYLIRGLRNSQPQRFHHFRPVPGFRPAWLYPHADRAIRGGDCGWDIPFALPVQRQSQAGGHMVGYPGAGLFHRFSAPGALLGG